MAIAGGVVLLVLGAALVVDYRDLGTRFVRVTDRVGTVGGRGQTYGFQTARRLLIGGALVVLGIYLIA